MPARIELAGEAQESADLLIFPDIRALVQQAARRFSNVGKENSIIK